jgi:methylglutaconyl-CoA hydratase
MNYTTIQLAYDSGIATITLNRPDKRNAISFELIDDLLRALQEVETSDAIVLILTGAGKAFSSGMDLDNLKSLLGRSPEQNLQDSQTMVQLFRSLYEFPKVTIAAVNGAAIAGGTGWPCYATSLWPCRKQSSATPKSASALCPPSFPLFFCAR